MAKEHALINDVYLLEKFSGKGGWTYARIPEVRAKKNTPFGWKKVKGSIDGYEIRQFHLMPMGNGILMLPVKADIRKKIGKKAGDKVHVVLYADNDAIEVPAELQQCLDDEPAALRFFNKLSDSEKRYYIQWVYTAKREETRISRLAKTINRLVAGLKMYDKAEEM
jgi:Uncharacterized protein conserved in bacteria